VRLLHAAIRDGGEERSGAGLKRGDKEKARTLQRSCRGAEDNGWAERSSKGREGKKTAKSHGNCELIRRGGAVLKMGRNRFRQT